MIGRQPALPLASPALMGPGAPAAPGLRISTERFRCLLLWLTGVSGAIVFIEPSPYEAMSLLTLAMFIVGGLTLSPTLMPLAVLLVLVNIGYGISGWTVIDEDGVAMWLVTSWYMAITALFFAAVLGANTEARLKALTRGCVIGGVIASFAAIIGYFRVFPSLNDLLLLYDRARGTFKDPNVLGAFLIFPTLLALQPVICGNLRQALKGSVLLGILVPAILLSFSRAAWGQIVYTAAIMLALTFITTRSPSHRLRLVLLSIAGAVTVSIFIAALLSIDSVDELFKERASLHQDYDVGAQGRFARHILGAIFALDKPVGVGPLQFHKYFPEDTHNSFLNAFMSGGWLAGECYPALMILTLVYGFRAVFVRTPWQQTTITVFAAYFGVMSESFIIDIDHWRHAFLLLGLMWGLIAAARMHQARVGGTASDAPSRVATARPLHAHEGRRTRLRVGA
jgi:hypothetical protein